MDRTKNPIKPQNYLNFPISGSNVWPVFFLEIDPYDIINSLFIKYGRNIAEVENVEKFTDRQTDRQTEGQMTKSSGDLKTIAIKKLI